MEADPANNLAIKTEKSVGDVYKLIGWNRYHSLLFVFCGLGWMADAIETGLLSYLKEYVTEEWENASDFALTMLQFLVFVGEFIGCFIWGPMADRIGRRKAFLFSNIGLFTCGIISAFSPSLWCLIIIRTLCGVCISGITVAFDALIECVAEDSIMNVGLAIEVWWTGGTIFVNVAAELILSSSFGSFYSWRVLCIACAIPILLALGGYFVMEESPLWLQESGRREEALNALRRIAERGNTDIGDVVLEAHSGHEASVMDIMRVPYRTRTITWSTLWLLGLMGYYGASLAGTIIFDDDSDEFEDLTFSSCGELVGIAVTILMTIYIGAVKTMNIIFFAAACFIYAILAYNVIPTWLLAVFTFFARACVMGATSSLYVSTPMSYPTYMRCTAHAFGNLFGRVGGGVATILDSCSLMSQMSVFASANLVCAVVGVWVYDELVGATETLKQSLHVDTDVSTRLVSSSK